MRFNELLKEPFSFFNKCVASKLRGKNQQDSFSLDNMGEKVTTDTLLFYLHPSAVKK